MPDIRRRVEEDQGLLKKIQLIIPGYRGYRQREDLRDSDKMLRMELKKRLALQRKQLEESRGDLVLNAPLSKNVESLGGIISKYKKVEGVVDHAETGYSGLAADLKVKQNELSRLYDYDLSILENIGFIDEAIGQFKMALDANDEMARKDSLKNVKMRLTGLEEKFNKRIAVIQGIEQ